MVGAARRSAVRRAPHVGRVLSAQEASERGEISYHAQQSQRGLCTYSAVWSICSACTRVRVASSPAPNLLLPQRRWRCSSLRNLDVLCEQAPSQGRQRECTYGHPLLVIILSASCGHVQHPAASARIHPLLLGSSALWAEQSQPHSVRGRVQPARRATRRRLSSKAHPTHPLTEPSTRGERTWSEARKISK